MSTYLSTEEKRVCFVAAPDDGFAIVVVPVILFVAVDL